MQLEPKVANAIVDSLKDIIHHEINLFDTTGTIIASTDTKRVGTFHDGAYQVIRSHEPVIISSDDEFHGARKGTNLPVLFNDSVVAVIGITGDPEAVAPLGNIIKKMTEILIRENWSKMTTYTRQANFNSLVIQLISQTHDHSLVDYLFSVLEISPDIPRRIAIAKNLTNAAIDPDSEAALRQYLSIYPDSFFALTNGTVCIFLPELPQTVTDHLLQQLQGALVHSNHTDFAIGVGQVYATCDDYWHSYHEAQAALSWLLFTKTAVIKRYEQLDLQLLLTGLPDQISEDYLNHVLAAIPEADLPQFKAVLNAYVDNNGSIIHGAETLYIHKNTFQNHLNHIHTVTGFNPRNLKDFVVLYLAFKLDDFNQFKHPHQ